MHAMQDKGDGDLDGNDVNDYFDFVQHPANYWEEMLINMSTKVNVELKIESSLKRSQTRRLYVQLNSTKHLVIVCIQQRRWAEFLYDFMYSSVME